MIKKVLPLVKKSLLLVIGMFLFIILALIAYKFNTQNIIKNDNFHLEKFLLKNSKDDNRFYCKYRHIIENDKYRVPNSQQYVYVTIKNDLIFVSGSERSAFDVLSLPLKYVFDEKNKTLKSEGSLKYYIVNKRKIIIEENAEQHVGPIRTPIKDMPYQLEILFEGYPLFLINFYVNFETKSEDGDMKMSLSCKT
jgi:hypothetical protein